jgi:hypothetical protein
MLADWSGDMPATAQVAVGGQAFDVIGVDIPRKLVRRDDGSMGQDLRYIGVMIAEDLKEHLTPHLGQIVHVSERESA